MVEPPSEHFFSRLATSIIQGDRKKLADDGVYRNAFSSDVCTEIIRSFVQFPGFPALIHSLFPFVCTKRQHWPLAAQPSHFLNLGSFTPTRSAFEERRCVRSCFVAATTHFWARKFK